MSGFVPWEHAPAQYSRIVIREYDESLVNLHAGIGTYQLAVGNHVSQVEVVRSNVL